MRSADNQRGSMKFYWKKLNNCYTIQNLWQADMKHVHVLCLPISKEKSHVGRYQVTCRSKILEFFANNCCIRFSIFWAAILYTHLCKHPMFLVLGHPCFSILENFRVHIYKCFVLFVYSNSSILLIWKFLSFLDSESANKPIHLPHCRVL